MEGHNRVLVVLESGVRVLLVNNALTRELLVVVGHLNCQDSWVVDGFVSDNQLTMFVYFRSKFVCA